MISTSDSATCSEISEPRSRPPRSPVVRVAPRSASMGFDRDPMIAGATPNSTPVTSDAPNAKPITSEDGDGSTGTLVAPRNASLMIARAPANDTTRPAAPPTHASRIDSMQQLPDQPHPRGAERHAHRHLGSPRRTSRQQQAGEVGAGDQEHRGRERLQQPQGWRHRVPACCRRPTAPE